MPPKMVQPSGLTLAMTAKGGCRLGLTVTGGDLEVELSTELWKKLGESAAWFAGQMPMKVEVAAPAASAENGVLKKFEALVALDLEKRMRDLEARVTRIEKP